MRNKYSKAFEEEMISLAPTHELTRLWWIARSKYAYFITKSQLRQYLSKRKIRYKDYNENKAQKMGLDKPIGSEYAKPDGMVLVKIAKDKWEYKQRYLYEQYHNIELPTYTMVIFLDGDKTNFDINNLMAVESREYNFCRNKGILSKEGEVTKTSMLAARLHYKAKEKLNESRKRNN